MKLALSSFNKPISGFEESMDQYDGDGSGLFARDRVVLAF